MSRLTNDFNGMLVIRKEPEYTSSDVVAKLRGILHMKKIGHTGTLDPAAVGVLPVCLGMGTKLADLIADRDKEYEAVLRLGVKTDTQDMTGEILESVSDEEAMEKIAAAAANLKKASLDAETSTDESGSVKAPSGSENLIRSYIESVILSFVGDIDQIPPMYSAVWMDGKRLYELARQGKVVEREPRHVRIEEIEVLSVEYPLVRFRVVCSKGTYIRTLCEDIGDKLGVGGSMEHLTRTRVGIFTLDQALTLDEVKTIIDAGDPVLTDNQGNEVGNNVEGVREHIVPIDAFFAEAPAVHVKMSDLKYIRNGNPLGRDNILEDKVPHTDRVRVYDENGDFWALYHWVPERRRIIPIKMFHVTDSVAGENAKHGTLKTTKK